MIGLFLHHLKEDFKSFQKIYTFIINESTVLELWQQYYRGDISFTPPLNVSILNYFAKVLYLLSKYKAFIKLYKTLSRPNIFF